MLFYFLFFWLIDDRRENIWKYTKLVEIAHFNAYVESFVYLVFIKFKNYGNSLHTVSEELRQIVIEMFVDKDHIILEVIGNLVKVEEDFLEVLLD